MELVWRRPRVSCESACARMLYGSTGRCHSAEGYLRWSAATRGDQPKVGDARAGIALDISRSGRSAGSGREPAGDLPPWPILTPPDALAVILRSPCQRCVPGHRQSAWTGRRIRKVWPDAGGWRLVPYLGRLIA